MLKIRADQTSVFQPQLEENFAKSLAAYCRDRQPAVRELDEDLVLQMVVNGIARARSHGLTWQSSIALFVGLMFAISPNFDEYPPIRLALKRPGPSPDERMSTLLRDVRSEHWQGAVRRADARSWGIGDPVEG